MFPSRWSKSACTKRVVKAVHTLPAKKFVVLNERIVANGSSIPQTSRLVSTQSKIRELALLMSWLISELGFSDSQVLSPPIAEAVELSWKPT